MNVLIGGGFGWVGSYLTPYLVDRGFTVGVIARRVPATLQDLAGRVDCHTQDLNGGSLPQLSRPYDCFVHLAGSLHSVPSQSADLLSRTIDVTRRCLELCRANGISRFLYFSTFQVYGRDHGFVDESTPVAPQNDYALAHHLAEEQVRAASRDGGPDYVIVRPTNGYGFSDYVDVHRWSLVPSCLCRSAVEDGEIVLRTSGHQQKDFIHVEQIACLTTAIGLSFDRFRNQVVNLACGSGRSIIDVARLVEGIYEQLVGTPCRLRVLSDRPLPAEPLVVGRAKTADLGCAASDSPGLAEEITKTLAFLTRERASLES